MAKLIVCKTCGEHIAGSAKSCPKCGATVKTGFLKILLIIAAAIVIIGIVAGNSASDRSGGTASGGAAQSEAPIEYMDCSASDLISDLENNALSAKEKYKGQYIRLSGNLRIIDSNGKYFSVDAPTTGLSFVTVTCDINNQEQKSKIASMSVGDSIVVKGKVTSVGKVMGYNIDVIEIE